MNAPTLPTVQKTHWFWAWEDHKEEAWLGDLARQGLHLVKTDGVGSYIFAQGEPRNVTYRLDFRADASIDRAEYLQLFADAGWEHVAELLGWEYFRKECQPGETPEIFTDNESKIAKYQRLLTYLLIMLPIMIPGYIVLLDSTHTAALIVITVVYTVVWAFLAFAMVKISLRIRQLKKTKMG